MVICTSGRMTKASGSTGSRSKATSPVGNPAIWQASPKKLPLPKTSGQQAYRVAIYNFSLATTGDAPPGAQTWFYSEASTATAVWLKSNNKRCPSKTSVEIDLHSMGNRRENIWGFTLQFSGFWVGRGGLGEVESLVGDCRPPPPGNPRRPTCPASSIAGLSGRRTRVANAVKGGFCFTCSGAINRDVLPPGWKCSSLNKYQNRCNLKELNDLQYFKKNRSYSSCTGRQPVLEFIHFHSHLCGQLGAEPPPIAITNVLVTR